MSDQYVYTILGLKTAKDTSTVEKYGIMSPYDLYNTDKKLFHQVVYENYASRARTFLHKANVTDEDILTYLDEGRKPLTSKLIWFSFIPSTDMPYISRGDNQEFKISLDVIKKLCIGKIFTVYRKDVNEISFKDLQSNLDKLAKDAKQGAKKEPINGLSYTWMIHLAVEMNPLHLSDMIEITKPATEAKNLKNPNEALKQELIDYLCDVLDTVEPEGQNSARYRSFLENMSVEEFDTFIKHLENNDTQIHMYMPNVKTVMKQENINKAAEKVGVLLQEKIWITDAVTGKKYLTPNEYVVLQLPIRRVSQFLLHKMSVPESDKKIDILTGQVTSSDRSSSITQVEIQSLFARDMKDTLIELVKIRGGDVNAYADFKQQISETGEASLENMEANSTARSVVIASTLLKGMMIGNNLYEPLE